MSQITKFTKDIVIGLEIHVGINTRTKLFCNCKNEKTSEPNKYICPVCLGHPGSKPLLNKEALKKSIALAYALNCEIAPRLIFSRKSYFYPDLVKNYQITQFEEPLGKGGYLIVGDREVELERIHMEEDPGALLHKEDFVLIDYNRSGTPLCEIVTKPVIESAKEAREFIKKIVLLLEYVDVFDNGIIKADLNISIKETNYTRVEIKGVSGHKDVQDALEYEIKRQQENPKNVFEETRGWDSEQGVTFFQRKKESESDYGYIYDPDITPFDLDELFVKSIIDNLPELADDRIKRYIQNDMPKESATILTSVKEVSDLFDICSKNIDNSFLTNFFRRDILSRFNAGQISKKRLFQSSFKNQLIDLMNLFLNKQINDSTMKDLLDLIIVDANIDVVEFAKSKGFIIDKSIDLESHCRFAVENSPNAVSDYHSGKESALNYVVGQVLKKLKGKVLPAEVLAEIKKLVDKK